MVGRMIITGHGAYASGVQSTVELIAGKNDRVTFVDFEAADSSEQLKENLAKHFQSTEIDEGLVVVCDLIGGTPFKMAAELALTRSNVEVIAGCNIGAVVEGIIKMPHLKPMDLAEHMKEATIKSVARLSALLAVTQTAVEEDGI